MKAKGRRDARRGVITRGSLVEGLEMKLDPSENIEDMKAGKFVVIEGDKTDAVTLLRCKIGQAGCQIPPVVKF